MGAPGISTLTPVFQHAATVGCHSFEFLTHRNCEIINVCDFKLLNLGTSCYIEYECRILTQRDSWTGKLRNVNLIQEGKFSSRERWSAWLQSLQSKGQGWQRGQPVRGIYSCLGKKEKKKKKTC